MSNNELIQIVLIAAILAVSAFCIYTVIKTASLPKKKQREIGVCIGYLDPKEKNDYRMQDLIRSVAEMDTDNTAQLLLIRNKARKLNRDIKERA